MCFDNPGEKQARAAEQAEQERQSRISGSVRDINAAFRGREPQYNDFLNALREQYSTALNRERQNASRQTKFSLARAGLTGGSAAVDAGTTLRREAEEGVLAGERNVQHAVGDLRSADEASRLQMIALAQSGSDIGNAATQTANALRANLGTARGTNVAQGVGDVFGKTAANYRAQQEAAQRRKGFAETEKYANPFSR